MSQSNSSFVEYKFYLQVGLIPLRCALNVVLLHPPSTAEHPLHTAAALVTDLSSAFQALLVI